MIKKNTILGNWGLDRIDQYYLPLNNMYNVSRTGRGVDVCIICTGIDKSHKEFKNINVNTLYDFREDLTQNIPYNKEGWYFVNTSSNEYGLDDNGLGTFLASIITGYNTGVATLANLYSLKVFDKNLNYEEFFLKKSLDKIKQFHLNKSVYSTTIVLFPFSDITYSKLIEDAFKELYNLGLVLICSAGNEGKNISDSFPANMNEFIKVASSDKIDRLLVFTNSSDNSFKRNGKSLSSTNIGNKIDIIAPGYKIKGAFINSNIKKYLDNQILINDQNYIEYSGNDVASAFVAGAACLYAQEQTTANTENVRNFLISSSLKNILNIQKEYSSIPNRLLNIPFRFSKINWNIENEFIGIKNENEHFEFDFNAILLDNNSIQQTNKIKAKYYLISGNLPNNLNLSEEGKISGILSNINDSDPGYINKFSLPQDEQNDFLQNQIGYIDYRFSILVDFDVDSDIKEFKIRVIDINDPLYWTNKNTINLNNYVSALYFYYKNNVYFDLNNFINEPNGDNVKIELLNGELPPGLTVSTSGKLTGTVGAIFPDDLTNIDSSAGTIYKTFDFVLRATDNFYYTDNHFQITIFRNGSNNSLPVVTNSEYNVSSLSTFEKGVFASINFEITDADNDKVLITEVSAEVSADFLSYLSSLGNFYFGIPSGLKISGNKIEGIVDVENPTGYYIFSLNFFDGWDNVTKSFLLKIDDVNIENLFNLNSLFWETAEGFLGEIDETCTSYFQVKASSFSNNKLIYTLETSSNTLPPGLSVDSTTGLIKGKVSYVSSDTEYNFTIKCALLSSPSVNLTRDFSIKVNKIWGEPISEFYYYISGRDKLNLRKLISDSVFKNNIISENDLYRKEDENYDNKTEPKIFIIGGINILNDDELFNLFNFEVSSVNNQDYYTYFKPISIRLGEFKNAVVRNNKGDQLYELIYLEVYDEANKSLGIENNQKIIWENPNSANSIDNFFISNILTWREKIKLDSGMVKNIEKLPLWMKSPQSSANSQDILNYTPAIEIVALKLGTSETIKNILNLKYKNIFYGKEIKIDHLVYHDLTNVNKPKKRKIKFLSNL